MLLGIPIYEGVNLLDVTGPLEMFFWAADKEAGAGKDLETVLLSEDGEGVWSHNGVYFKAPHERPERPERPERSGHAPHGPSGGGRHRALTLKSFADAPPLDVLWVPGAGNTTIGHMMSRPDSAYLAFLRRSAATATWVCSVCEGALLLARAGLLDGHEATTHWAVLPCLKRFPVTVVTGYPRYVVSGNRLTGGGVSSGLDEALQLIRLLYDDDAARTVQRVTQYFPDPPVWSGITPETSCTVAWT